MKSKKGFTLVELIVVMTILAILGTVSFLTFSKFTDDAEFSKEDTLMSQASRVISLSFVKDFAIDGVTNTDHAVRFVRNQGAFTVGTEDTSDNSDLSYVEAAQVFEDNIMVDIDLTSSQFNVKVCDLDATNANLDSDINAQSTGKFYELIIFTDETATGTDCTGIITPDTTRIAGYTFRYKNAKLDGASDSYDSKKSLDGGARVSLTPINTVGENLVGEYKSINDTLSVVNLGY